MLSSLSFFSSLLFLFIYTILIINTNHFLKLRLITLFRKTTTANYQLRWWRTTDLLFKSKSTHTWKAWNLWNQTLRLFYYTLCWWLNSLWRWKLLLFIFNYFGFNLFYYDNGITMWAFRHYLFLFRLIFLFLILILLLYFYLHYLFLLLFLNFYFHILFYLISWINYLLKIILPIHMLKINFNFRNSSTIYLYFLFFFF